MTGGMMFKGTPGEYAYRRSYMDENEWEVYPLRDGPPENGEWSELCTCKDQYGNDIESEHEAENNARLFAAAPKLLEALLMLQKQALQSELNSPNHEWGLEALAAARAAIAKALGEQK